jgi:hypothetical protein
MQDDRNPEEAEEKESKEERHWFMNKVNKVHENEV